MGITFHMKKAIFGQYGSVDNIKIIDAQIPSLKSNQTLVKVKAAALNPKDILIRKGKFKRLSGKKFPQTIGFDYAGIVEKSKNKTFKKGDKVFGMINGWQGKSCSNFISVKANELWKMPSNLTFEEAAGIPLAGQTALQALKMGNIKQGDKILINGASGGVGTLAIQIAKAYKAQVTTISSSKNIDLCYALGADYAIAYDKGTSFNFMDEFDIFFDVFGNYSFRQVNQLLSPKGLFITTVPKKHVFKDRMLNFLSGQKTQMVYVKSNQSDLKWLCNNIEAKKLKPVIDSIYSLEDVKEAQSYVETKRAKGKVILSMDLLYKD